MTRAFDTYDRNHGSTLGREGAGGGVLPFISAGFEPLTRVWLCTSLTKLSIFGSKFVSGDAALLSLPGKTRHIATHKEPESLTQQRNNRSVTRARDAEPLRNRVLKSGPPYRTSIVFFFLGVFYERRRSLTPLGPKIPPCTKFKLSCPPKRGPSGEGVKPENRGNFLYFFCNI